MSEQELTPIDDPEARPREQAIDLYIRSYRPTAICRQLHRSRIWFYNTLDRYRQGGRQALASRSRAPQHSLVCRPRMTYTCSTLSKRTLNKI
jgi:hypothetical protein